MKKIIMLSLLCTLSISCKKTENSTIKEPTQTSTPCEDVDSYNQGVSEGRSQKGILTDCDTYYPYEGWANNKECWCKGFNDGYRN